MASMVGEAVVKTDTAIKKGMILRILKKSINSPAKIIQV